MPTTTKPKAPAAHNANRKPSADARLDAVVELLLGLEDVLAGSAPNPEDVRALYTKLKEANQ